MISIMTRDAQFDVLKLPELSYEILGRLSLNDLLVASLACKAWYSMCICVYLKTHEVSLGWLLTRLGLLDNTVSHLASVNVNRSLHGFDVSGP